MGLGKTIEGFGISDIYHANPEQFIRNVAERFKVNVVEYYPDGEKQNLRLELSYHDSVAVHSSRSGKFISYDINFPIAHPEKEFSFSFYPNNVFSFSHIPFSNGWKFFIEELFGDYLYTQTKEEFLKQWQSIRHLYLPLLQKLNCGQLLITTHGNYRWEQEIIFSEQFEKKYSFEELINCSRELDDLQIFSFHEAMDFRLCDTLRKVYEENTVFDVAFVDSLSEFPNLS